MVLPCDWQTTKQKVAQRCQYLLEMGQWADCKFLVGQEPNQCIIEGHKVFLAMTSPVFEAMFYSGVVEKTDPIPIKDVKPEVFKALLEYIYTDQVDLKSFEMACELCYCAKKYMLPFLVKDCIHYLWSNLCPKKACKTYEFAKLYEEADLMEKCLHVIRLNTDEVLNDTSWKEINQETVLTILNEDKLYISSELILFNALEKWAKAECIRKSADSSDSKALRSVIGDALTKIRFLTLTPQEFAEGPGKSLLLSQEEAFSLLMNISSSNSSTPMPENFSYNKLSRRKNLIMQTFRFDNSLQKMNALPLPINPLKREDLPINLAMSSSLAYNVSNLSRSVYEEDDLNLLSQLRNNDLAEENASSRTNNSIPRYCCLRSVEKQTAVCNEKVLESGMTFTVDKNICILGLQIPSQILNMPGSNQPIKTSYTEVLYAHLLDSFGTRLTYTHFRIKVEMEELIEVTFNRPVFVQKNKLYKIGVVFTSEGWYPLATCSLAANCDNVAFQFGTGNLLDMVKDGLIRSIIFTYR